MTMNAREPDPIVGPWRLDRPETAAWIEKRALRSSPTVLESAEKRARQQRAMLDATEVEFTFRDDGTFQWKTVMRLPQGTKTAWTHGRWSYGEEGLRIEIVEQEGQRLTPPPRKTGRFSGDRIVFEDPLMDLVLQRVPTAERET